MCWECGELDACETLPNGIPEYVREFIGKNMKKGVLMCNDNNFSQNDWENMVRAYSEGSLTNIDDKCVAFAGIVEDTSAMGFPLGDYFAGF